MKRTYVNRLPKNEEVKNTNVRIENGELVVEVEFEDRFEPKDGDFLVINGGIFIYNPNSEAIHIGLNGYYACIDSSKNIYIYKNGGYDGFGSMYDKEIRYATPVEKEAFLARLEKEYHKRWNEEKKCLEDIRWRAKLNEGLYYVGPHGKVYYRIDYRDDYSNGLYEVGNYFRTEEAAQKVSDQIKEIFKNSEAE